MAVLLNTSHPDTAEESRNYFNLGNNEMIAEKRKCDRESVTEKYDVSVLYIQNMTKVQKSSYTQCNT